MFRPAQPRDIAAITAIYDAIHTENETGRMTTSWIRGVYPTRETAAASIQRGDMWVAEAEGRIVAAAKINREQMPEYAQAAWHWDAPEDQVMVLHTLVVAPQDSGKGYGSAFVAFYEQYASQHGCRYLRMDTSAQNLAARTLYKHLGYTEADIVSGNFNGIAGMQLVCLEKKLSPDTGANFPKKTDRHRAG